MRDHDRRRRRVAPSYDATWKWLACLVAPLLSGCYTYTPVPLDAAPPGENVRLIVSREGAREFATALDTDLVSPVIDGSIEAREGETLIVRVPLPANPSTGPSLLHLGQVIRVPVGEIVQLDRRELSWARTGLLAAAAAGASALIVLQITDSGPGNPDDPQPDPDVFLSILRIPIG